MTGRSVVVLDDEACRAIRVALELLVRRYRIDGFPVPTVVRDLIAALGRLDTTDTPSPPTEVHGVAVTPGLLDLDEVATALRCSRRTIERRVKSGTLPSVTLGRVVRVRPTDLAGFIANLETRS